jgi:homoprotocatechuate degradation regulator HpaR
VLPRPRAVDEAAPALRDFSRSLPMALLGAREAVMGRFRPMLHQHGVTEQQWRVLRALSDGGEVEISGLARRCVILMPSLSRILRNLETRGLIRRRIVAADQRRARIDITASGRALIRRVAPHSERHYAEIAAVIGTSRLDALYALLDEITAALDEKKD